jgi:hypothetical protein
LVGVVGVGLVGVARVRGGLSLKLIVVAAQAHPLHPHPQAWAQAQVRVDYCFCLFSLLYTSNLYALPSSLYSIPYTLYSMGKGTGVPGKLQSRPHPHAYHSPLGSNAGGLDGIPKIVGDAVMRSDPELQVNRVTYTYTCNLYPYIAYISYHIIYTVYTLTHTHTHTHNP